MTWLDDRDSGSPSRAPSCPVCGSNDDIERLNRPIAGAHFWCGGCDTVFAGTSGEWERNRSKRERWLSGFYRWRPLGVADDEEVVADAAAAQ